MKISTNIEKYHNRPVYICPFFKKNQCRFNRCVNVHVYTEQQLENLLKLDHEQKAAIEHQKRVDKERKDNLVNLDLDTEYVLKIKYVEIDLSHDGYCSDHGSFEENCSKKTIYARIPIYVTEQVDFITDEEDPRPEFSNTYNTLTYPACGVCVDKYATLYKNDPVKRLILTLERDLSTGSHGSGYCCDQTRNFVCCGSYFRVIRIETIRRIELSNNDEIREWTNINKYW